MTFTNRNLSPEFPVEDTSKFVDRFKSMDKIAELSKLSENQQYGQFVAAVAKLGLPDEFDTFETLLDPLEVEIRKALAIPSKRPGGARSKGTGYVLHPTFKSYKATVKGAYEYNVELLDAAGVPRSRDDVSEDIKLAKPIKDPEEKLMGAVEMFIKLRDASSNSDARTVDADNRLVNYLRANGWNINVGEAAVA